MRAAEGKIGRIFVIRLEDGDIIPNCIENFAKEKNIRCAQVIMVGGIGKGSIVVGPRHSEKMPPDPMLLPIDGAHEVAAVGVLAPNESGEPILHIHGALGRAGHTITGCLRQGVSTWLVDEVILLEITGAKVIRAKDPKSGFSLLQPE